jgi:hypothetical protein
MAALTVQVDWRVLVATELLAVTAALRRAARWDPDALAAPTLARFEQTRLLVVRADRVASLTAFAILEPFLDVIRTGTTTGARARTQLGSRHSVCALLCVLMCGRGPPRCT